MSSDTFTIISTHCVNTHFDFVSDDLEVILVPDSLRVRFPVPMLCTIVMGSVSLSLNEVQA
jgi:hypothetical protein